MRKRLIWNDYVELARLRKGVCIHPHLPKRHENVMWQCERGHIFAIRQDNVKAGAWCPICSNSRRPWTMERVIQELQGREIKCISTADMLKSIQSKLTWECEHGHRWSATVANITHRKSGCPYCRYKTESWCREVFEDFFDSAFPKVRPSWLYGLELDGYSPECNIAFEYQGQQHYREVPHFSVDKNELELIQESDRRKAVLCRKNFISLYQIKHHPKDCSHRQDFKAYVEGELVAQLLLEKELLENGTHWLQTRIVE